MNTTHNHNNTCSFTQSSHASCNQNTHMCCFQHVSSICCLFFVQTNVASLYQIINTKFQQCLLTLHAWFSGVPRFFWCKTMCWFVCGGWIEWCVLCCVFKCSTFHIHNQLIFSALCLWSMIAHTDKSACSTKQSTQSLSHTRSKHLTFLHVSVPCSHCSHSHIHCSSLFDSCTKSLTIPIFINAPCSLLNACPPLLFFNQMQQHNFLCNNPNTHVVNSNEPSATAHFVSPTNKTWHPHCALRASEQLFSTQCCHTDDAQHQMLSCNQIKSLAQQTSNNFNFTPTLLKQIFHLMFKSPPHLLFLINSRTFSVSVTVPRIIFHTVTHHLMNVFTLEQHTNAGLHPVPFCGASILVWAVAKFQTSMLFLINTSIYSLCHFGFCFKNQPSSTTNHIQSSQTNNQSKHGAMHTEYKLAITPCLIFDDFISLAHKLWLMCCWSIHVVSWHSWNGKMIETWIVCFMSTSHSTAHNHAFTHTKLIEP